MSKTHDKLIEIYNRELRDERVVALKKEIYRLIHGRDIIDTELLREHINSYFEELKDDNLSLSDIAINESKYNIEKYGKNKSLALDINLIFRYNNQNLYIEFDTSHGYKTKNPEHVFYYMYDHMIKSYTDKTLKISDYFKGIYNDCEKILIDIAFDKDVDFRYDFAYKDYNISEVGCPDYTNDIAGRLVDYTFRIGSVIDKKKNLKNMYNSEDIMEFAKENLDGSKNEIVWYSHSV